ncbi:hypothetical protein [Streptomyces sp. NPDC001292]|uniref:hypothetical protein n=1 Tax=Streptomyces sp. NPDC001292 TaxID=3364558 RepID=UPI00368DC763
MFAAFAAFAAAVARACGHRRFLLNTLQLNRLPLHPDVSRLVGAFSSTMLLPVDLPPAPVFADLATRAQQDIGDALAHNLITGVEVSRELGRRRGTHRPVAPSSSSRPWAWTRHWAARCRRRPDRSE